MEVGDICCSHMAFAALRRDGRVVAWGSPKHGGDASEVQERPAKSGTGYGWGLLLLVILPIIVIVVIVILIIMITHSRKIDRLIDRLIDW